jgi:hypothetical protein
MRKALIALFFVQFSALFLRSEGGLSVEVSEMHEPIPPLFDGSHVALCAIRDCGG